MLIGHERADNALIYYYTGRLEAIAVAMGLLPRTTPCNLCYDPGVESPKKAGHSKLSFDVIHSQACSRSPAVLHRHYPQLAAWNKKKHGFLESSLALLTS
jgi:hypothetical protein